ncbi:MAG: hypothetical protein INQ03_01655 [Candidatus Heimdallarchaeota archaeon]|nr:hypothetical protein [Candidatus Heimdallarchaeota archaeon]
MVVPIFFFFLIFSGVMGIIAISLTNPSPVDNISGSVNLSPGEFDYITIYFDDSVVGERKFDIALLHLDEGELDLYLVDNKPDFSYQKDFALYEQSSEFSSDLVEQDLGVSYSTTIYAGFVSSPLYLVIVNPSSGASNINCQITINISLTENADRVGWVLSIVGISLFTLAMLLLTIFTAIEFVEPKGYRSKLLTQELEDKIKMFLQKTEPWEMVILVISTTMFPIGVGMSFASIDTPITFFSAVGFVLVYFSVKRRYELFDAIKSNLNIQKVITLDLLAKQVRRKPEDVRRAIFYLISHESYPIRFDAKAQSVSLTGSPVNISSTLSTVNRPPMREETIEEVIEEPSEDDSEEKTISCAYCGSEALVPNAKFCADCGASMVATK